MSAIAIRAMTAADVPAIALQASQIRQYGLHDPSLDIEHGHELIASGPAWAAERPDGEIACLAGFIEPFGPARQGYAWALLGRMGSAHLAITRFMRLQIWTLPYRRVELVARATHPRECRWAEILGLTPRAVLEQWGPASETVVLYDRVRG